MRDSSEHGPEPRAVKDVRQQVIIESLE